jgi:SNF2 family DNA or RNA helicase
MEIMEKEDAEEGIKIMESIQQIVDSEIRREMEAVHVIQPRGMERTLFPHQLMAVQKMEHRETNKTVLFPHYAIESSVGIYADITGYGKTIAVIALVIRDIMSWDVSQDHVHSSILSVYGHGCILKKSLLFFKRIATTIVVASTMVLHQWEEELKLTTLRHGMFTSKRKVANLDPMAYDVILVAPQCFNSLMERFPNYAWKRFIFDEPTHTKVPGMRPIIAGYIWFVTATPDMLLYTNRHSGNFMGSIFSTYMDYNLYKNLIVKNDDAFVKQSFELPPLHHLYHTCYQPVYNVVHNMISENILAMISAGNVEGAVKALGGNSTSNIYDLIRFEKTEYLEECIRKIQRFERLEDLERKKRWEERKERLEHEIKEFNSRYISLLTKNTCSICHDVNVEPILLTCCQNMFCGACILQWLQRKSTCPLCRKHTTTENFVHIRNDIRNDDEKKDEKKTSFSPSFPRSRSKINTIIDLIMERGEEGKFIVFSSFDESFDPLCQTLNDHGVSFCQLQGRAESRAKQIIDFKNGPLTVLLLNSVHDGAGMNLQESTDVVLYHSTSEDLETQIIGRAYRLGRTKSLYVHHLV